MRMRWTILCIAACWLLPADAGAAASPAELARHRRLGAASCVACHPGAAAVLAGPMATRAPERAFASRALGRDGGRFFDASCGGCHVRRCADCHGEGAAFVARPPDEACLACHRGYFVGWAYHGRAPREDHERYQRGAVANGEPVLRMAADVHAERGLGCADCHALHAQRPGVRASRTCRDCHPAPSPRVPEHAIAKHMEAMECWACHSAWAPQEYGTFLVRPRTAEQAQAFDVLPRLGEWRRSAYLRRQDAPPLGLDERGLVAPIRPEFTLLGTDPGRGWENRLLADEWAPFFPHTVRRGTTSCTGCHDTPRRFLLEPAGDRVWRPDEDGLPFRSFWDRHGQKLRRGTLFPPERFARMNRKSPEYVREHLKQWQAILDRVGRSSAR